MINLKELRIGNYALFSCGHEFIIRKVMGIVPYDSSFVIRGEKYVGDKCLCTYDLYDRINPIPLTEDILLKCGFEKGINDDYDIIYDFDKSGVYYCDQITITYNTFDCCIYILQQFSDENDEVHCNNSAKIARDIKYLHDLQNLFYDLTKTELNIQL